jgi:hypothetical protein
MIEANIGDEEITKDVLDRLNDLIKRGQDDDRLIPEIRQFFDEHPEVWQKLSDIGYAADLALASQAGRNNSAMTEAYLRRLAQMKAELVSPDSSQLETLLAASVCTCFLAAAEAQITAKENIDKSPGRCDFLDRRLDRAVKRYQAALKTLALLRKLLLPAKSPSGIDASLNRRTRTRRRVDFRKDCLVNHRVLV